MEFSILHAIQGLRTPFLDLLMKSITSLGNKGMIWVIAGLILICIKKYRKCGIVVLLSLLASLLIGNMWLKNIFERERPCWIDTSVTLLIHSPRDYSFPSGHTYSSFSAAVSIFLYHKKLGIAAFALAGLIAFSRLYLFVHFPTDVLGGLLLGIITAIVVSGLVNYFMNQITNKVSE